MTRQEFNRALASFVESAQDMIDAHQAKHFALNPRLLLIAEPGPRFVRIMKSTEDGTWRYPWAFIDRESGDILKPDGADAPERTARGNIFSASPLSSVTPYGVFGGPEVAS